MDWKGLIIGIVIAIGMICQGAFAQNNSGLCQIEVIVFQQPQNSNSEQWDNETFSQPLVENSLDLSSQPADSPYQLVSKDQYNLDYELKRLLLNGNYKILLHLAWQQPILPASQAQAIHIYGGPNNEINGTIIVSKANFYNINTNLIFTVADDRYQLAQTRRTRINELNYLDHPMFGVLIKIIPVTTSS